MLCTAARQRGFDPAPEILSTDGTVKVLCTSWVSGPLHKKT